MKPAARRIVCATDFSGNAGQAADVAAAFALRLRATLVLVHVADEAHAFGESTKDFRLAMRGAKARLRAEARRLQRGGLTVEPVLLHGRWAEHAIGEWLALNPPLLVVVSSVSKTTFDRWTLGSVSEHIAQHAPVPTLVVREPARLLAWARQEQRLSVMVAVDFTVSADAALAFAKDLRKIGECAVTVAHINWPPDEQRWSPRSGLALSSNPSRVRRQLRRELQRKVAEFIAEPVDVQLEENWGRPDAALVRLATEADVALLVVGTHQRHGVRRVAHASISRGVLRHAPMAVVCVPAPVALAHGVGHHPQIRRVLVASDLSPSGDQAVPWAYAAVAAGGTVKLLHVMKPWEAPPALGSAARARRSAANTHQRRIDEARDKLAALVPAAAGVAGVRTDVEVMEDPDIARAIGIVARKFGPDLICLAASERSAAPHGLFGSVVRDVMRQNRPPLLLVRPAEP